MTVIPMDSLVWDYKEVVKIAEVPEQKAVVAAVIVLANL
jgi:hypothetical protein